MPIDNNPTDERIYANRHVTAEVGADAATAGNFYIKTNTTSGPVTLFYANADQLANNIGFRFYPTDPTTWPAGTVNLNRGANGQTLWLWRDPGGPNTLRIGIGAGNKYVAIGQQTGGGDPQLLPAGAPGVALLADKLNRVRVADPNAANPRQDIQSKIDALATEWGGGVLYLPPGTYALDNSIRLESHVWLVGSGMRSTVFQPSGDPIWLDPSTIPTFFWADEEIAIGIFNVKISGAGWLGDDTAERHGDGISLQNVQDCRISNCWIENVSSSAIHIYSRDVSPSTWQRSDRNIVSECFIYGNQKFGFHTKDPKTPAPPYFRRYSPCYGPARVTLHTIHEQPGGRQLHQWGYKA